MRARDFWLNKINYLRFSSFPRFSPPPTTNQVLGSSNLSGRANLSYRCNILPRFSFPGLLRSQVVAEELRAPGVLPGSRASSETRPPPLPVTSRHHGDDPIVDLAALAAAVVGSLAKGLYASLRK
jgi:hypothetical protein